MKVPLYQVDAFSTQLFKGNPAAVCPLGNWLPDEVMQHIAAENNLAETAFYVVNGDDFDLRWFTPAVEVDLCGHATLATAHVLYKELNYQKSSIKFHTRSGILVVEKYEDGYKMDFPVDNIQKINPIPIIAESLQAEPVTTYKGKDDFMVVLDSQEAVENLKPDFRQIATLDGRGLIVTAPGRDCDFVSRGFFPQCGIDEDPVTGSAHTTMTPYWADRLGKNELTAQQISKRFGSMTCHLAGNRVYLIGHAVTYLKGEIEL